MINKSIYLAIGVNRSGLKEVICMWGAETEGAKFWLSVITELKNRGVKDIFISCVDGLKGFPQAIEAVFPSTEVQTCIVHRVRKSLSYLSYKDRTDVVEALNQLYQAATAEAAERQLAHWEANWSALYPIIGKRWRASSTRVIPFFAFPH